MNNKTVIVTGACSAMGMAVIARLSSEGFSVIGWCRHNGVDLFNPNLNFGIIPQVDAVIHISEVGPVPLMKLWEVTRASLVDRKGVFIGLSSIHHLFHDDDYAKSKREQERLMRSMALWSPCVRVNCLRLGHIIGTKTWPQEVPERLEEIPLGRFGKPQDVAEAISFIVKATWMTGSILALDGGISLKLVKKPVSNLKKIKKWIKSYKKTNTF